MYLAAVSPSIDEVRHQIAFLDEKEGIDNALYEDFFETQPAIVEMQAKTKGISLFDYKNGELDNAKEKALKELEGKYGYDTDSAKNDPREAVRQKYKKIQEKQQAVADISEKAKLDKIKRVGQLFVTEDSED